MSNTNMELNIDLLMQQGLSAHQTGKLQEAETCYKNILQNQSNHPHANHNLGILSISLNNSKNALTFFKKAIQSNPYIEQFWASYISTLINEGQFIDAKKAIKKAKRKGVTKNKINHLTQYLISKVNQTEPTQYDIDNLTKLYHDRNYDDAIKLAKSILQKFPKHLLSWKILGVTLQNSKKFSEALIANKNAVAINSHDPAAHSNLGNTFLHLGKCKEAVLSYNQAIALKPDYAQAHFSLGNALAGLNLFEEAIASYKKALKINNGYVDAYYNLGNILQNLGRYQEAETNYKKAINLNPKLPQVHNNLGNTLTELGRLEEAKASYNQAVTINPSYGNAHNNLGNTLKALGLLEEAEISFRNAIAIIPDNHEVHYNLGILFKERGELNKAEASYNNAIALKPDYVDAYYNLGNTLQELGLWKDADESYNKAIVIKPDFTLAYNNKICGLNYSSQWSIQTIYQQHLEFEKQFGGLKTRKSLDTLINKSSNNKLRIGYVSGDFKKHSITYFFEPLLEYHSANKVEIFCYYNDNKIDEVTKRLIDNSDHWRSIYDISDEDLFTLVRDDKIDILVDLSGHTAKNRLLLFAMKPAPIQVSWLGYPNTTGLSAIDYRFTDISADPLGEADELHSETLLRLPNGFLCYKGNKEAYVNNSLPHEKCGHITFGSFNNFSKLTPEVIKVWSSILHAVPKSRLILKSSQLNRNSERNLELFKKEGVSKKQIKLYDKTPSMAEHLKLYNSIDIGLDPFPYNGTTTTCDALWMGVPVITLLGDRHASRVGASILTNIGLSDFIAQDVDGYINLAIKMTTNINYLQGIRQGLRDKMVSSPLCNAPAFANDIENAYKAIWNKYLINNF